MAGQYIELVPVVRLPRLTFALPGALPDTIRDALPGACAICHGWGRGRLCGDCLARFAAPRARCRRCAIVLPAAQPLCGQCLNAPPPFEQTVAALDYEHPWRGLIAQFKFHAALELAPAFARCLAAAVQRDAAARPDWLLPVPLSAARLRERGYNQAWELARRLGTRLQLRADASLLLRMRDTAHQLELPPEQRAANVRDAFAVEPRRRFELEGREVALVDDVLTTGATAAELARVLLAAGSARVQVWVLARTPRPDA